MRVTRYVFPSYYNAKEVLGGYIGPYTTYSTCTHCIINQTCSAHMHLLIQYSTHKSAFNYYIIMYTIKREIIFVLE